MPRTRRVGPESVKLTELSRSSKHRVVRLDPSKAALIASFGIYPGVVVELRQRHPTYVIWCGNAEIAMDGSLAAGIWVERKARSD